MNNFRRILCHVGPWSLEHYRFLANELANEAAVVMVSGHPKCDEAGFFQHYYHLISNRNLLFNTDASEQEIDIILRCRLLRVLDRATALLHLRAAWKAMGDVLDKERPDLILTETIDSYVMDILYFQAIERGIQFIGLVPTFISGYFRVSARGEFVKSRDVSDKEASHILEKLLHKSYRPDFIKNSDSKLFVYAIGRWLRNIIKIPFFTFKRFNRLERFNYHNWATLRVALDWVHAIPALSIGDADWQSKAKALSKPVIYIPLQMIPEATVDYWCEDIAAVDYNTYLVKLVRHLSSDFTLLIKEHPNVLGYRNPRLYHLLQDLNNVIFAPTAANSHELIDAADAVLVWTGSVGFEAAIRGKPVLTTCKPYYQTGPLFLRVDLFTSAEIITKFICSAAQVQLDDVRKQLIKHVLSGALPGRYIIDGSWSISNPEHVKYAENIAAQLALHITFNRFSDK